MAQVTINIDDAQIARVLSAFGKTYFPAENRSATPAEVKAKIRDFVLNTVRHVEQEEAMRNLQTPADPTIS